MTKLFLFFLGILFSSSILAQYSKADSLISVLKFELHQQKKYDSVKKKRIAALQSQWEKIREDDINARYALLAKVFDEYNVYQFDSAFNYVNKMIKLSEGSNYKELLVRSQVMLGQILLKSGLYKEAFETVEKIDTSNLSKTVRTDYYVLRARLNESIADYDNDAHYSSEYRKQSAEDFAKAAKIDPPNDFEKTISLAFLPKEQKQQQWTPDFFYDKIIHGNLSEHNLAMVATRISYAYEGKERIPFLALAAINDIRSSTKETLAIFLLGQELFKLNKTSDAYTFVQGAVDNAHFYGARKRAVQIESVLPLIATKLLDEKQNQKQKILVGLIFTLTTATILLFLLILYRKQLKQIKLSEIVIKQKNKELADSNDQLWESAKIKEELIGSFFNTCSSYIEKIDYIKSKSLHNIKLGKYNDIQALLKGIQVKEEKDELYNMLDTVFLMLFPHFITDFNSLLKNGEEIIPKADEKLNATLRIFALMRLGIKDQEAIAKILDYSVSTVYTYRMRIKSKTKYSMVDFENKIMQFKLNSTTKTKNETHISKIPAP